MKQFRIYLWIALWAIGASFAQAQNNPDSSTVHGLRELGSRSMTTGVQSTNHSGIPVSNVAELNTAADELKAVIEAAGVTDFKVFDYASYPFLTFLGKEADGDAMMKAMEEKIAAITPAVPYYLLIGKIIDENGKVNYKVKLKLPTVEHPSITNGSGSSRSAALLTDEELVQINNGVETSLFSNENGATRQAGDGKPTVNGINTAKKLLSPPPRYLGVNADALKGLYVLSPDGKIVTSTISKKLRYVFDMNSSIVHSYCYQRDIYDICLPWEEDAAEGYGYVYHIYVSKHYEPPTQPLQGKIYKVARLERRDRCFVKVISVDWTAADIAGFPNNFKTKTGTYIKEINTCDKSEIPDLKAKEIQDWLKSANAKDTEVRISKCDDSQNQRVVTSTNTDAIKGAKKIWINLCFDDSGKWNTNTPSFVHGFAPDALKIPPGYTGTKEEVEKISNAQVEKIRQKGSVYAYKSEDGELEYKGLGFIEALIEIKEATKKLCNDAKVPEKAWDDKDHKTEYDGSAYHFPTLSGVGDGAISELKSIPELVSFGLTVATEPDEARKLWKGIKSITPTSVKKMIIGAAQAKKDKYAGGGNTMKHEVGVDGVSIAMMVVTGGGKNILENAGNIEHLDNLAGTLDNVAAGVLTKIDNAVDADAGKYLAKYANDADFSPTFADELATELAQEAQQKGRKLTKSEVEDIFEKKGWKSNTEKLLANLKGAKGLIGNVYEDFLAKNLPNGGPGFTKGGRDFDAIYDVNKWVEAKSGNYWNLIMNDTKLLEKFKSDMGSRLKIAKDNVAEYHLFSNTPIPDEVKTYLLKKGIPFFETLN